MSLYSLVAADAEPAGCDTMKLIYYNIPSQNTVMAISIKSKTKREA